MKIPFKFRTLLWYLNNNPGTKIYDMPLDQARRSVTNISKRADFFIDYKAIPMHEVFDHTIQGRNGDIPIRIYRPTDQRGLPVIMFFHGGGFVLNDLDSHDKICRRIARDSTAIVIAVDYRLAPEHKFPKGVHDAYDATVWAKEHPDIHQGNVDKLIVMGDSAGGNLATVVCQIARDQKGPDIAHQVLIYPCTDGRLQTPSIEQYKDGYLLTKQIMSWFLDHYKKEEADIYHSFMSPILSEDLSNLPPAFILTAEYDPLRDEGRQYADLLKNAGNEVIHKDYGGMIHGFIGMPRLSKKVLAAYEDLKIRIGELGMKN